MRRSPWLARAASWLLLLAACGAGAPANAPSTSRSSRHAAAPGASNHRARPQTAGGAQELEPSENLHDFPEGGREFDARRDAWTTSEQLAQRYGKTHVLAQQQGSASYYGDSFAGRSTASGAPYEPRAFTAAHRNLPFGTVLRVTRVDGGQAVYVQVTDRGPYGPRGRILDLSRAAAERLGMLRAGVVKVHVEIIEYGARKPRRRRH
jgi:rare lipoprotein A